jgi:hypothetical protein
VAAAPSFATVKPYAMEALSFSNRTRSTITEPDSSRLKWCVLN